MPVLPGHRFQVDLKLSENYAFDVAFHVDDEPFRMDEPVPLGDGNGPNAARVLAAAVGNCLSASLLFCLRRGNVEPISLETSVEGEMVRSEEGRLRIERLDVSIDPRIHEEDRRRLEHCLEHFESFCIVTQSVRAGIDVQVDVAAKFSKEETSGPELTAV
jgi:organic hydroperoxide reductase OsmC/OhrA